MRSYILTFLFVFILFFVVVGCAAVKHSISAYDACQSDPDCYARMMNVGNVTSQIAANVPFYLQDVPVNGAAAGVGMLASVIAGVVLGWKKCKRKG